VTGEVKKTSADIFKHTNCRVRADGRQKLEKHRLALTISDLIFILFLAVAPQSVSIAEPLAKITVEAGEYTRVNTPVFVALDGISAESRLEEIKGHNRIPVVAQIEADSPPRLWWILSGTTEAGSKRVYELVEGLSSIRGPVVDITKNDSFLEIQTMGSRVLRYTHALVPPPKEADKNYARSGFIHPLWSPAGAILTNIHPADHIHHMGLWMPWTKTKFEGREVDFWNLGKGEGTVRFAKFVSTESGPVYGGFRAIQEHVDFTAPGGEKVALNEELNVRVWNVCQANEYRLLDYTSKQRCASSSPLHLLKYRYGGFGFRATSQWNESNSDYLTSEGKTRKDGHGTRARWCNVFGTTERRPAGVLFMSHPDNREHPEPMRIWPKGDVFFNFCPVQKADWTLKPGNDYVLRYRLYVYNGAVTVEKAESLWQNFANPPKVKLEKQ
jgi:hypothetical protein